MADTIKVMNPDAAAGVSSYLEIYVKQYIDQNFGGIEKYANFASFPSPGNPEMIYIDTSNSDTYYWDGTSYKQLNTAIIATLNAHIADNVRHTSQVEKDAWNSTATGLAAEILARQGGDTALDDKINVEIARAMAREDVLHDEIDTERTRAIGEEARIENKIDVHAANTTIHVTTSDRFNWDNKASQAALEQEKLDRANEDVAIRTDLTTITNIQAQGLAALVTELHQEVIDRQTGDTAEAVIRAADDATEASTRAADDTTERLARIAADDAEQGRAIAAENLLQDNIDAEAVARQNADDTHDDRLEALENLQPTKADKHNRTMFGAATTQLINFPELLLSLDAANPIPSNTRLIIANLVADGSMTFTNKALNDLLDKVTGGTMVGDLLLAHDPAQPLEAATKKYIDDIAAHIAATTQTFKGYISATAPDPATTAGLQDGFFWYQASLGTGDTPDIIFPWSVSVFDSTSNTWSATPVTYEPDPLDLWANMDADDSWYWLGDVWHHNDFGADVFNNNHFTLNSGILSIADGAIMDAQVAANAAIQISKIDGLQAALDTKMELDTGAIVGNIPIFDNDPATGDVKDSGYKPADFELSYGTQISPGAYHSVAELATQRQVGVYTIMPGDFVSYPDLPPGINTGLPFFLDIKKNALGTGCFIRGRQSDGGYFIAYEEYNNPLKDPGFIKLVTEKETLTNKYVHIPDGSYTSFYDLLVAKGPGLYYVNDVENYSDKPIEVSSGHFYIEAVMVTDNTRVVVMGRVPAHPGIAGQLSLKPKFFITDGSIAAASQLVQPWECVLTSFNGVKKIHDRITGYTSIASLIEANGAITCFIDEASLPAYTDLHVNMVTGQKLVLDIRNIGDTLFEVMATQNSPTPANFQQQNLSFLGFYSTASHAWVTPLKQYLTEENGRPSVAVSVPVGVYTTLVAAVRSLGPGYWQIGGADFNNYTDKYITMQPTTNIRLTITQQTVNSNYDVMAEQNANGAVFRCAVNYAANTYATAWSKFVMSTDYPMGRFIGDFIHSSALPNTSNGITVMSGDWAISMSQNNIWRATAVNPTTGAVTWAAETPQGSTGGKDVIGNFAAVGNLPANGINGGVQFGIGDYAQVGNATNDVVGMEQYEITAVAYVNAGAVTVTWARTALPALAIDNSVVHKTGNETVAGIKTFGSHIIVPGKSTAPVDANNTTQYATEAQLYNAVPASLAHANGAVLGPINTPIFLGTVQPYHGATYLYKVSFRIPNAASMGWAMPAPPTAYNVTRRLPQMSLVTLAGVPAGNIYILSVCCLSDVGEHGQYVPFDNIAYNGVFDIGAIDYATYFNIDVQGDYTQGNVYCTVVYISNVAP